MFFSGFKGGIHPPDKKEQTGSIPISTLEPAEQMIFIMSQGGRGTVPCVQKGDRILKGQVIGQSPEFMSAPVHSSVSGIVEKVDKALTPRGDMSDAVIIKNDFLDEEVTDAVKHEGYVSKEELIKIIRGAGIVGMGGAGFPSHVKLATDKKIDTVIINASECEPYLTSDYRVMLEAPEAMIDGLDILLHALGIKNGVIAMEDNKRDAAKALQGKIHSSMMKIKVLKTKYPQGSEKQLIYAVTGRMVPEGGLPADVGAIVFNVDTVSSISRAVRNGEPVLSRIVTVAGSAVKNPGNFRVRVGTPFSAVFEAAGGFTCQPKKIIMGGPMMGTAQYSVAIPVTKTTSGLLALTDKDLGTKDEAPCIRCGKCVAACPMGLMPVVLTKQVTLKNWDEAKKSGIMSCIECGCCAYSCPSDRNPVAVIRRGKNALRSKR